MKNSNLAFGLATGVALALVVAITGCAPAVHTHSKAIASHTPALATAPPTPTASPTAAALGPLPANALFRITATVTEPTGEAADLVQTVFAPAPATASDTALLNAQCNLSGQPTWQSTFTNPLMVTTTVTATMHPGSAPWPASDQVAAYFMGSTSAYSGDFEVAQAYCAPGYITIPGTLHGVAPVEAADPATGSNGWASQFGDYGFDGSGNDPGEPDESGTAVVGNCVIEESAAAKAASGVVEGWLTQPFQLQFGCHFQGAGPA
jgi:hypothetical protein